MTPKRSFFIFSLFTLVCSSIAAIVIDGCATIPGQTTAAPFLEFTNSQAYLLGHPVTSNQVYTAALAGSTLGTQLLLKDDPGASNYLSDAQLVVQSIAYSGVYSQTQLATNLAAINLKSSTDQALLDSVAQTVLSVAGVYIAPLISTDTNSAPYVQAALYGLAGGL